MWKLPFIVTGFLLLSCGSYAQERTGLLRSGISSAAGAASAMRQIDSAVALAARAPDQALELLHTVRAGNESRLSALVNGRALLEEGNILTLGGRVEEGERALREAIAYLLLAPEGRQYIPHAVAGLGKRYAVKSDYENAIRYFYKSIAMAEAATPGANMDYVYNNLAGILTQVGRNTEGVWDYLDKAEHSAIQRKDDLLLAKVYNNKGFAWNTRKAWDSSRYYFGLSLALSQTARLPFTEHLALTNTGITYLEQNRPAEALPYLLAADSIHAGVPGYNRNLNTAALGHAYLLLKDYKRAEKILLEQYREAERQQQAGNVRAARYYLARLYGSRGDYRKAYENAQAYIDLNNSLSGDEIIRHVNQEEVRFRTAEKDKDLLRKTVQIERQQKDLERKNRWIAIVVGAIIIAFLLLLLIVKGYRSRQKLLKHQMDNMAQQKEIERLKAETEVEERERARIARELHDGIGGLVSAAQLNIRALEKEHIYLKDSEVYLSTSRIFTEVGSELRKTAHNMMPSVLLQRNMEEAISIFCNYIRQNKSLHFDLQCYGDFALLPDSYKIAIYRMVQELVHNVVKHAHAVSVLVQLMFQQPVMSITIEDDGVGFDPEAVTDKGLGLKSMAERVKYLNGSFSIDSQPGKGASVYIELEIPEAGCNSPDPKTRR
ncbi:ATP-binding protein [Taibaiella helva]|uniref:ATP-binding protein n=1 Tax=Taibaiella helva TaxID=2301235 RepID=UPI000E5872C3|nr:ATP-binding protein [Taibaiella helva]